MDDLYEQLPLVQTRFEKNGSILYGLILYGCFFMRQCPLVQKTVFIVGESLWLFFFIER